MLQALKCQFRHYFCSFIFRFSEGTPKIGVFSFLVLLIIYIFGDLVKIFTFTKWIT